MAKSYLVIGLGKFGTYLAKKLLELGHEVMVVDQDESRVARLASIATASQVGDCQDEDVLRSLGIPNYEACFVCVRDNFQCSLETTSLLKELGARCVVSRADDERQIKFLKKIGADQVVQTEMEIARRIATSYSARNLYDYLELSPSYAIFEYETPHTWENKTVAELNIRQKYRVNILGIKKGQDIEPLLDSSTVLHKGDHLLLAGQKKDGMRLMEHSRS